MNDAAKLFEQPARVGVMIWIPGAVADDEGLPDALEDFCQNLPENGDHVLYSQLPVLARFAGKCPEPWEVAHLLRNHGGFLVRAETPVKDFHQSGGYSFSWGYHRFSWVYAPSEELIADIVMAWAKTVDDSARAKIGAAR